MQFAAFELLEELTESRLTKVYKAYHPDLDRTVLLKVLQPHRQNQEQLVARFRREAQACARVKHRNVVDVYQFDCYQQQWYIVLEFVDGQSMDQFLIEHGRVSWLSAIAFTGDCLAGLAAAHDQGVIHRDIKPGNILIDKKATARLTDFGLAHIEGGTTITQDSTVLGTPAYISPEQLNGQKVDGRTDLFSLGAVFYELVTGEMLFQGATFAECFTKVMTKTVPPIPDVPEWVNELCQKLLAKSADERFSSAKDALTFIDNHLNEHFKAIPEPSYGEESMDWITALKILIIFFIGATIYYGSNASFLKRLPTIYEIFRKQSEESREIRELRRNYPVPRDSTVGRTPPAETEPLSEADEEADTKGLSVVDDKPDSGWVLITSYPWAEVTITDRPAIITPLSDAIYLAAGEYPILFTNPAFPEIRQTLQIATQETTHVQFRFADQVGYITFRVSPWAHILLDDLAQGTTPLSQSLVVTAGQHTLTLVHPAFESVSTNLSVQPGDTLLVSCRMGQPIVVRNSLFQPDSE